MHLNEHDLQTTLTAVLAGPLVKARWEGVTADRVVEIALRVVHETLTRLEPTMRQTQLPVVPPATGELPPGQPARFVLAAPDAPEI